MDKLTCGKFVTFVVRGFFYVFSTGSSLNSQIYQTPAQLYISKETEEVKINCSHSIQGYDRILWYRQMNNRHLQFLGYVYGTVDNPEKGFDVKLKGDANKNKTCTLTIEKLGPNSSAVYFCAVTQHNARKHCTSVQKPHHVFSPQHMVLHQHLSRGFFPLLFFKVSFLLSSNTVFKCPQIFSISAVAASQETGALS